MTKIPNEEEGKTRMNRLLVTMVLATSAILGTYVPSGVNALPQPCVVFTINGIPFSGQICNPDANDLKIDFRRGPVCSIQWTLNGTPVGAAVPCPPGANDIEVSWVITTTGNAQITTCTWTHNETPLTSIPCVIPPIALVNDFHFVAGRIVRFFWTLNGAIISGVPVPPGTNDVEFSFL